jgi:predicted DNA-binding protein (UPF0251 family)
MNSKRPDRFVPSAGRDACSAQLLIMRSDSYRRKRPRHLLCEDALACDGMLAPERVQHAQVVRLVEGALTELSELERAAVRLCDLQGMGYVEAARSLGITPGYLRVALHRARHKLAGELNRLEALADANILRLHAHPLRGALGRRASSLCVRVG